MIKVILWDIDGTLLNFEQAEKQALQTCFSVFGLGICTDEMLARYIAINQKYWKRMEQGAITKQQVLVERFQEFFEAEGLTMNQVQAFNEEYQVRLGDAACFHDDGYELVQELKPVVKQYAVTNGTLVAQKGKLRKSGLDRLLDGVFISDQIGVEKPDIRFFDWVFETIGPYKKNEVMIVGDSQTSDMQGGNNVGILCCWYNRRESKKEDGLKIDYEITDLRQVKKILKDSYR